MQEIGVVLGADVLFPFAVDAPESLLRIPWCRERAGILDVDRDVDRLAAVRQPVTLDHVQLFGVGGQVRINKCFVCQPDRVHHQRIAPFVVADRVAVPGRLGVHRMRHVEPDVALLGRPR